jgi:hypothetical protein
VTIPHTYVSIHDIDHLTASPGISIGAPIVLQIDSPTGRLAITLFFRGGDEQYSKRLIEAINGVRTPTPRSDPGEDEAYLAVHYIYQGAER